MTAFPGTQVWLEAKKQGWLRIKNYDYSVGDTTLELPTVGSTEIKKIYKTVHLKYYLRPRAIGRILLDSLTNYHQFWQLIKGGLAILRV